MSDISLLSIQYEKLAATSGSVNDAVIILKKNMLLGSDKRSRYRNLRLDASGVTLSTTLLITFLSSLLDMLNERVHRGSIFLPSAVVDDYLAKLSSRPYLREEIKGILNKFKGNAGLDSEDMATLDFILAALDIERSRLFRKLRTARG